jgi:chromate reductase
LFGFFCLKKNPNSKTQTKKSTFSCMIKILGISGSLRPDSSNAVVLNIIRGLLPINIEFRSYNGIGQLPHFDGSENPNGEVNMWRKAISGADGIIICTPEYAFGVPGSLKNALDWTVYTGDFVNKPLALITASSQGDKAHASFQQIFKALSADLTEKTSLLISFIRAKLDDGGNMKDEATFIALKHLVEVFVKKLTA